MSGERPYHDITLVELSKQSCNCADWPRVQLCKHITSVAHFFGNSKPLADQFTVAPGTVSLVELESPLDETCSGEAATSILENVIIISKEFLSDGVPLSQGTVHSLHMVEVHLTAVVQNSYSSENLLSGKRTLPPTSIHGLRPPNEWGHSDRSNLTPLPPHPLNPPATQHIGDLNCKQLQKIMDLYTSGVTSGRDAAPDAQSIAQNVKACAHAAAMAKGTAPALSQPVKQGCKCVDTPAPSTFLSASLLPPYPPALAPLTWYPPHPTLLRDNGSWLDLA